jgi:peptidoglycan/LPS O-acetylase OafA/YrhL
MSRSPFVTRLEALRGVAALMVALAHSMGAIRITTDQAAFAKRALALIANGGAGVTIFFILSGHVLGLSLLRAHSHPMREWPAFVYRRVRRIYPAMTICLLFCWIYFANFYHVARYEAASADYYMLWQQGANWTRFLENFSLADNYLNPVTWTLRVEMVGALVFPLLFYVKRTSRGLTLVLLALWMAYFIFTPLYQYACTSFLYMFILGLFVTDIDVLVKRFLPSVRARMLVTALAFCICCAVSSLLPETGPSGWIVNSLAATVLVAGLAGMPDTQKVWLLDLPATRYLGRISYSFYLWHMPVLYIFWTQVFATADNAFLLAHPIGAMLLMFVLTCALAIALAHFSYESLERPFKGGRVLPGLAQAA